MRKSYLFFLGCFFYFLLTSVLSFSQTDLFFLDSASHCYFTDDAIYFHLNHEIVKSSYSGNILWSKHIDVVPLTSYYPKFAFTEEAFFGITDSSVYKIDTSGNTLWIKHFSNLVYPVIGASQLFTSISTDGSKVYVSGQEEQNQLHQYYKTMVAFDTMGNVLNAWSATSGNTSYDFAVDGIQAFTGSGVWIASVHILGNTHNTKVIRIDSNGIISNTDSGLIAGVGSIGVQFCGFARVNATAYIFAATHGTGNGQETVSLVNFDDNGQINWSHTLSSLYYNSSLTLCDAVSITADNSGYIYFFARIMDSPSSLYQRPVIIKFDSLGNLLWSKSWSNVLLNSSPFSISKIHFHNGKIWAFGSTNAHPAIISFDTSFSNLCLTPDTSFAFFINNAAMAGSNPPDPNPTLAYSVNSISPSLSILLSNQNTTPSCSTTVINSVKESEDLISYPSPFSNELTITLPDMQQKNLFIELIDILGKTILQKSVSAENKITQVTITTSTISSGLYMLQVLTNGKMFQSKVLKY